MRRKGGSTGQVGRSYKNSGRINNNQRKAGHRKGQRRGSGSQPLRQFQGYKTNEERMLQSKGSFHVREMVDAIIADRDEGHEAQ